jgi:hypothetical protein
VRHILKSYLKSRQFLPDPILPLMGLDLADSTQMKMRSTGPIW